MEDEKYWIAMVKVNDEYFVLASKDDNAVHDFQTREKALEFFTGAYDRASSRSYQGSVAALLSASTSHPRVLEADLDLLTQQLFDEQAGINPVMFGAGLGFMRGLKCNRPSEGVQDIYDSGETPQYPTYNAKH